MRPALPRAPAPAPVSLLGTFMFFPMLGFTVNTLTLFGLVLAIGWACRAAPPRAALDAARDVGELERAASGTGAVRRRPSRR